MSEAVSSKPSKAGKRWLDIVWRILVAVLMLLAVLGFIISLAGIAGVWYARPYARSSVIDVTTVTTKTLVVVNNGLGRVTQALPNGFCGLPVQKTCPHANACLTCPMFVTTPEFLPQHHQQRQQVLQIMSAAQARGQLRLVEMNQQVLGNLDRIISALKDENSAPGRETAADAS